jgi:glycosyltransferase involved in cell wall biosynthesis
LNDSEPKDHNRRAVTVICASLGGAGAGANVASKQVRDFDREISVSYISDSFPGEWADRADCQLVKPRKFDSLHRFAHVPGQLSFAIKARKALLHEAARGLEVGWVITHGHVVAALLAKTVHQELGAKLALVVHGDVFDRPRKMYGLPLLMLYRWAAPRAYKRSDLVYTLSDYGREIAIGAGAPLLKTKVLPNALDPTEIGLQPGNSEKRQYGFSQALNLLFVGRLSQEKGVDILLRACGLLHQMDVPFNLKVVGEGPEQTQLKSLASDLGLGDCIQFAGPVEHAELGNTYRAHDIVCMPSRSDPFPLVALESMASGALLLAASTGALQDLLAGGCGILLKDNAPEPWAKALADVHRNPENAERIAGKGQQITYERYSWEAVSARLQFDLFNEN